MDWYEVAETLEAYLPRHLRITPGSATGEIDQIRPLPLPVLEPGQPLYDKTKAYIQQSWGQDLPADAEGWYDGYPMPLAGKRAWWNLLRASRVAPAKQRTLQQQADLDTCLRKWADWFGLEEARPRTVPDKRKEPTDGVQRYGSWLLRPGEASFNGQPHFQIQGTMWKLLRCLAQAGQRTVSHASLKEACGNEVMEDSTLRNHVFHLNRLLKQHLGLQNNPITAADQAYRLQLP